MIKQRGTILISQEDYINNTDKVQLIFSNIIPYRIEHIFCSGMFEVLAMSEAFEPVEEGVMPPMYQAEFWEEEGHTFVKFRKVGR
jgi:hypothetical protein